jgi:hypothetical protein
VFKVGFTVVFDVVFDVLDAVAETAAAGIAAPLESFTVPSIFAANAVAHTPRKMGTAHQFRNKLL